MSLQVRKALESDWKEITDVVMPAFGNEQGQEIAGLIANLLEDPSAYPLLSLVATTNGRVVGHILFTSTQIKHSRRPITSAILAPLSVHPEHQNKGIGGKLIKEGLKQLTATGVELVFVLGHPGYYPKYGFSAAGIRGLDAPHPIPPDNSGAWMVQELHPGTLDCVSGQVICAAALNDPKHWRE
jgi:predicted N-acetyltransferase YhbS